MPKRTKLSLSFKMDVIKTFEENPAISKKALADHFNLADSTLKGILKNKDAIIAAYKECGIQSSKRSRIQGGRFEELEKVLVAWFEEACASNNLITIELLRKKAVQLSEAFKIKNFSASYGWVEKFKNRHGLGSRTVSLENGGVNGETLKECKSGTSTLIKDNEPKDRHSLSTNILPEECASISDKTVEKWKRDLAALTESYKPKDIFSCGETGLFFKLRPNKILTFKGDKCDDGEKSKERLTILLCCNSDGSEKFSPLIIGNTKNPDCFNDVADLPCEYASSRTSCMTPDIFVNFLRKFDKKMKEEKRKVLLFIDQGPAHPKKLPNFSNTKTVFFPADCKMKLQPLNLGVIRCLKMYYRENLIHQYLAPLETKDEIDEVSILDAMLMVCSSWISVTKQCIKDCFKEAGFLLPFVNKGEETEIKDEAIEITEEMWQKLSGGLATFDEYVDVDEDLITAETKETEDITNEVKNVVKNKKGHDDEDNNDEEVSPNVPPDHTKALEALETLRSYLHYNSGCEKTFSYLYKLEKAVFEISMQKQK